MVLGLLGGLLFWLRGKGLAKFQIARGRRGEGRRMESIERLALSAHHSLHLVRVGDRALLVAVSPGGCSVLEAGGLSLAQADRRDVR
jgi:flagellar biogenesis protein FliO